jgi:hypothetical protein
MPIDHWLETLSPHGHHMVDGDLAALAVRPYPFLSADSVCNQITRLSKHLGALRNDVRRQAIAYSLYVRQLDAIQEAGPRDRCKGGCPRPPVGCCTANHFVILSLSDVLVGGPSPAAMHLSHVITGLQRNETAHSVSHGQVLSPGHCDCLAADGCTLRLFKSPRCVHYLCREVEDALRLEHGGQAPAFIAAMKAVATQTITAVGDFTGAEVISTALALFG